MKKNPTFIQICRNRTSLLYAMLLLSLLLGACADEPLYKEPEPGQGVKIHLHIPAQSINQTRAGGVINDAYVDPTSVYVFVLSGNTNDSSDKVLQVVNAVAGSTDNLFFAKLAENSEAKHVYVVANAKEIIEKTGVGELAKMTLGQLKLQLNKTVTLTGTVISQSIDPQPMFGEMELTDGINTETTIGSAGSPVPLIRSTSKITIANKAPANNFTLVGANLFHAPQLGYIVPEQAATGNRYPTGVEGDIEKMISTPAVGNEKEAIIYSFESAKKTGESTFVIIQTKYLNETHYYRLNLNNKEADYALLRNHHYMVDILKIDKKGYTTAEEASQNPAANIDYVINVVDETGRNIIAADGSYLAVSQTEYYYYTHAKDEFTNREVAVVTYKAPASVTGSCTTTSQGIRINSNFPAGNGGVQSFPLKVTMATGTNEGTVTLKLGSLERDIKVYRKTVATDFHFGTFLKEFKGKGYISGTVDKKNESWIKLTSADEPTAENQFPSLEDKEGKINIRVDAHLGDKEDLYRIGAVDLFREDAIGNARVEFNQKMFDIYTPTQKQAQLRPFTYIATFHRWNQTGERIIRVDAKVAGEGSPANVNWRVHVISGDFIRLSKTHSADGGVGQHNFYGEGDNTNYPTGASVENLQVTDGKTEITSVPGGEPIYFRVGLTGQLASATAQPRYGLIALVVNTHTTSPTIRYIYVRQGEEADYLMRPEDAAIAPSDKPLTNRPLAKKISPFNLTDKRGLEHSDLTGDQLTNVKFADYPSQGGYHYQPTTKNGWWADKATIETVTEIDKDGKPQQVLVRVGYVHVKDAVTFNTKDHEICPSGYRRPGENHWKSVIESSEMRQSMWLYPKNDQVPETQNSIMGYMADGYYDRRPMHNKVTFERYEAPPNYTEIPATTAFTAVGNGSNIAYIGVLSFNPHSLASIFMPLSGHFKKDQIVDQGKSAGFWTQTTTSNQYWTVDVGYLIPGDGSSSSNRFLADNYKHGADQSNNIRCIKE